MGSGCGRFEGDAIAEGLELGDGMLPRAISVAGDDVVFPPLRWTVHVPPVGRSLTKSETSA
jgi:hypothetical protein